MESQEWDGEKLGLDKDLLQARKRRASDRGWWSLSSVACAMRLVLFRHGQEVSEQALALDCGEGRANDKMMVGPRARYL